jgi:RNA polymerase sigma-70 factor (ECF subfamily)
MAKVPHVDDMASGRATRLSAERPAMKLAREVQSERLEDLKDTALVERARQRDPAAFRLIMKRHNQRLYRVARAVLGDDSEAEDVVQDAYFRAFQHLSEFRAEARLSTWLTRIALNEALGRRRKRHAPQSTGAESMTAPASPPESDPERAVALAEIRMLLERAVDALSEHYRIVFMMRDVEEFSTEETALLLGLRPETVKTRLHRARRLLGEALRDELATVFTDTFPFAGEACDRLTQSVLARSQLSLRHLEVREAQTMRARDSRRLT